MVMLTSVVVPARQRLTRRVPAPVFSAFGDGGAEGLAGIGGE